MQNAQRMETGQANAVRSESMDADLVKNEAHAANDNPFGQNQYK